MTKIFSIAAIFLLLTVVQSIDPAQLDLADLGAQIYCTTHRNPFNYNGYGCYCGFGGSDTPVDGVDACCQAHDNCYGHSVANGECTTIGTYADPYYWSCDDRTVHCSSKQPNGKCAVAQCTCDSGLANCLKDKVFHNQYKHYDKNKYCHNNS